MVDITPKLYIELTLEMLPKVISKLTEAVAKNKEKLEAATDPQQAVQILFGIIMELRNAIGEDVLPKGVTGVDMETYKAEHEVEIKSYLESNPDIKEKWDGMEIEFKEKFKQISS